MDACAIFDLEALPRAALRSWGHSTPILPVTTSEPLDICARWLVWSVRSRRKWCDSGFPWLAVFGAPSADPCGCATALRLAEYFDVSPGTRLNLQTRWDVHHAGKQEGQALAAITPRTPVLAQKA